jgi:endonuclease/exonuclease/phosphatase family metal-dependent hydrolase
MGSAANHHAAVLPQKGFLMSAKRTRPAFLVVLKVSLVVITTWATAHSAAVAETPTGTFLDRPVGSAARLVTYNVNWDSIFDRVNPERAAGFARVAGAIDPDIWAFQEVGSNTQGVPSSTTAELKTLLDTVQPTADGWHVWKAGSLAIASRWPLSKTGSDISPAGDTVRPKITALVDLPDNAFPTDLYVLNAHYRCCSGTGNDQFRQKDSDAIINWIGQAKTPGGNVELPLNTAMTVLGDFNIVGGLQPLDTLLTGEIQDTGRYGPSQPPDWDGTPSALLDARHNALPSGPLWTWRDDNSIFLPGRLDFITYTDSVMSPVHSFVLNTAIMTTEELLATGLQPFDALLNGDTGRFDHLPIVMDFVVVPEPGGLMIAALIFVLVAGLRRRVIAG